MYWAAVGPFSQKLIRSPWLSTLYVLHWMASYSGVALIESPAEKIRFGTGLPDGLFSNKKSKFG
jgi:hypothetical protein